MKKLWFAMLLLSGSFLLAQDSTAVKHSKGEITVQGCVGRSSGDYVLTKQNPAMTTMSFRPRAKRDSAITSDNA